MKYSKPNFEHEWSEALRYREFEKMGKDKWLEKASKDFEISNFNSIKEMLNKGENINDTNVYDKYMKGMVTSVSGNHILNKNHHISMHLYINLVDENGRALIEHQSFNNLVPHPFMGIYDKIFTTNANYLYYSGNIQ